MKAIILPAFIAVFLIISASAAGSLKRLPDAAVAEQSTRLIVKYRQGVVIAQGDTGPGGTRIFEVDKDEAEAFAAQLRTRPEIEAVALDVIVRNPPLPKPPELPSPKTQATGTVPSGAPTDPAFDQQTSWRTPDEINKGAQNLLAGYLASERTEKLRVGILDSGFYTVSDLKYTDGYNFSRFTASEAYGPVFLENEINPGCTSPHGTAVSGIIGATANNGEGIAGILDAELIATRVMSCGTGLLSDTALGIRWLAGDPTVSEAPPLSQPVNIINASLGAEVDSCPFYLQDAIDYAHQRGILVVVAAGNGSMDATGYSPANCQNVVSVGSVGKDGELSSFSNFGDNVDVGALGELIATLNQEGDVSQWFGTSFATPIVAGAAGLLKQANPSLTPQELRNSLVATSRPLVETSDEVGSAFFSSGIVDGGKSVNNVITRLNQLRPDIRPALDAIERCNREAYLANAPAGIDYTKLFEVTVTAVELSSESEQYAIFRTTSSGSKELLHQGSEPTFLLRNVSPESEQLWFDVCDASGNACRFGKSLPM